MAQITWGDGVGAGKVHFNGHVSLSGCALVNAGAANEGLVLAPDAHVSDANTVALWRMDESAWSGVSNEVVDSGPNGLHGTAANGATTADGWINRCGSFDPSRVQSGQQFSTAASGLFDMAEFTLEAWVKPTAATDTYPFLFSHLASGKGWRLYTTRNTLALWMACGDGTARFRSLGVSLTAGVWQHIAVVCIGSGFPMGVYLNGIFSGSPNTQTGISAIPAAGCDVGWNWPGYMDDARVSNLRRYYDNWQPVRYKSAAQNGSIQPYADLSYTGLSGTTPSQISWTAQTGASYGKVHSVWVLDSVGGWTQVGGAYPTSPISVSGLTLGADSCVRFALEPKSDTIQSETPTLQDVTLEYTAPSTSITEAAPWTIGATATLTVRDVSGEQFASNGRRAQSYLPSIGRLAQEFFASGGRRA